MSLREADRTVPPCTRTYSTTLLKTMITATRGPSLTELTLATRQLALMVRSGIPIASALELLCSQQLSPGLRSGLLAVHETILEGRTIADGMRQAPHCFKPFYTTLVAAGEHAGILDQTLDTISEQLETQRALRSRIVRAAIYPCVVCLTLAVVVLFLLTWVVPTFEDLFAESGITLPWLTRAVLQTSRLVSGNWHLGLGLLVLCCAIAIGSSFQTSSATSAVERIALRIPLWRSLLRAKHISECSALLAALTRVGIPIIEGLSIATQTIPSSVVNRELGRVRSEISDGRSLSTAFKGSQYFPSMFSQLIEVGERSGQLEPMLSKAASFYRAEVEQAIDALKQIVEPTLIILIGAIVGTTVLAMYLPIFQIGELAGVR